MRYIELFAGCGGLSLGLKSLGSEMLLANELSPMASETFAYNLLNERLREKSEGSLSKQMILKTKWLKSRHSVVELAARLRENPQQDLDPVDLKCDLAPGGENLKGSLIVGSVVDLNRWLIDSRNKKALGLLQNGFGTGNVDLVSGGPPCQSFSMAGMRQFSNARNNLPWEFAKFVALVKPKFVLLENVSGILHPFMVDGIKRFAWFEVAQAFAKIGQKGSVEAGGISAGYVPLCLHVNARLVGVAQNRPRFIMLAFRRDVYMTLRLALGERDLALLESSENFFNKVRAGLPVSIDDLRVHDPEKNEDIFEGTFLTPLCAGTETSVKAAIDDLRSPRVKKSPYVESINRLLGNATEKIENHEFRSHGIDVQRRFRIYQVLSKVSTNTAIEARRIMKTPGERLSEDAWQELRDFDFYVEENRPFRQIKSKIKMQEFLAEHRTSKHSQKALKEKEPAPAALSIPDDTCHYHQEKCSLRALTVREMARIQSFPDSFTFCSKITTGGAQRKFEVPQYTQVGNAVPPLLGRALGEVLVNLLKLTEGRGPETVADQCPDAASPLVT